MLRKLLAGLGLGTLAALLVIGVAASTDLLDRLELTTYDWRMRLAADPKAVNKDIVLVKIDDASIRAMAPTFGRWPWPRLAMSFGLDFLKRAPAKVIAIDVLFTEQDKVVESYVFDAGTPGEEHWSAKQSERALADSMKGVGNVILLADAVYEGLVDGTVDAHAAKWNGSPFHAGPLAAPRPLVLPPIQSLTDASLALGHNFLTRDDDGPARRMAPFVRSQDRELPSLGVAAALYAGGFKPDDVRPEGQFLAVGDRRVPMVKRRVGNVDQHTMLINYRAPALVRNAAGELETPYPSYGFVELFGAEQDILEGKKPRLDPAIFKDKIVFIGLTASGLVDVFGTPLSNEQNGSMPGIQLHASMADSILANRFIRPATGRSRVGAMLIAALSIGMLAAFLPFATAALASLAILGGWTWFTIAAFKSGLWLNMVQPLAVGALALFFGTAYQYFIEGREKRKVAKLFGRYVSRDVYAQLMANPDQAELGGRRREMTVLFSDIRGFTTVTERGNPEELVSQLNEYFSRMVEIVFRHKGTVDKFVGDMVMALFSAPLDDPDHANHAVQAAVDMVKELGELNRGWMAKGMTQLDIGIGVNSGDMIAGNIGSSSIMSYTVIGDNVNLGARLESLNKDYKTRIIISEATRARLTGDFRTRPLGDVVVKGKSKAVQIFEIEVPAPLVEEVKAI
ncbi:MAG TPA: adenylate/guanylate cyclase domain-containing protein [Vicinamibacterales bacterium]|nr:adenylate/guanylate cyclase domain-containing protein [Vicinamibacterales bacterium]